MTSTPTTGKQDRRVRWLKAGLLVLWFGVSFGSSFFARNLQWRVAGWSVNYWIAAQGAILLFIAILVLDAWAMNALEATEEPHPDEAGMIDD